MSMVDWRYYPKIARIARMAGADVGRGSETLMTYSRGDLFRAARHLSGSKEGRPARALVVTGFYIPKAAQPAAETDGPLGALEVCMALRAIGGDAWLVSDECCAPSSASQRTTVPVMVDSIGVSWVLAISEFAAVCVPDPAGTDF